MEKMKCKVVMLPTDQPIGVSSLHKTFGKIGKIISYNEGSKSLVSSTKDIISVEEKRQHIHLLSDEEIQVDDFYIYPDLSGNDVWINKGSILDKSEYVGAMKVVASTDSSLKLPSIPQDFIKEYVESNGEIDEVFLQLYPYCENNTVIISKPKQCWTKDEVISLLNKFHNDFFNTDLDTDSRNKWLSDNLD